MTDRKGAPGRGTIRQVGIIGYPIRHSLSPVIQQAAFDFHGIPARYEAWETPPAKLGEMVARLRESGYLGANVTVPHKEAVIPLLDALDALARRIGAVNTVVHRDGRLIGYNTDAAGFLRSLEEEAGYSVAEKHALIVGAGGAARAVAFALLDAGIASLTVANRRAERAVALASDLKAETGRPEVSATSLREDELAEVVAGIDLLINATSVGMRHMPSEGAMPLARQMLRRGMLVCDLVYNPPRTPLLQEAEAVGAATLGGLPMLIYQGAAAFELWTGKRGPVGLMFERAREALRERD